ncbi:MAG: hypothetical protein WHZ52_01795 [Armatimonadota bacterium]
MKVADRCSALLIAAVLILASGQATANNKPANGTLNPSRGVLAIGRTVSVASTYTDADGAGNLGTVYLLMNTTTSGANAIYLAYNLRENRLYLRNDANTAWLGGIAPGQPNTVENARVRLRCQTTTVSASGNTLTVNWSLEPLSATAGVTLKAYLKCFDRAGVTANWAQKGTFSFGNMPVGQSLTPATGNLTPGVKHTLSAFYSDLDGTGTLANAYLLLNTSLSTAQGIYLAYNPVQNKLYVRNDAGTAWLGGVAPGAAGTISNSSVRVYCAETTVSSTPEGLRVNWRVEPLNGLAGRSCKAYLRAADASGLVGDWSERGALTISRRPVNDSVSPQQAEFAVGGRQTVTAEFSDGDGASNLATVYVLINTSQNGANAGYVSYQLAQNRLWLRNDANTAWLGGFAPGSSSVIENTQFRLYCSESSVTVSGNTLTLRLSLEAKASMADRTCGVWLKCFDLQGLTADWTARGSMAFFAPPATNTIAVFPSSLVLKQAGNPAIVRAAVIGADGKVVSNPGEVTWTVANTSLATVEPLGMDGLGEYLMARVTPSGTGSGTTAIQVTAGGLTGQIALTVANLGGWEELHPVENPAFSEMINTGDQRVFFFQTEPDATYMVELETIGGDVRAELFDNPALSGPALLSSQTEGGWDIPATRRNGTWFVKVTGLAQESLFHIRLEADPGVYNTEDSPSLPLWHRLDPGGPGRFGNVGRKDALYFYFDAEAGRTYYVEGGGPGTLMVAEDSTFANVIAFRESQIGSQIVPATNRRYYLRISGGDGGGFAGAKVSLPYEGYVSQPVLQLYPRTLLMDLEDSRSGDLSLWALVTGLGGVLDPPETVTWSASVPEISVTGTGVQGGAQTASVMMGNPVSGRIQVAAGGQKARITHFGYIPMLRVMGSAVSALAPGVTTTGTVPAGADRYYYVQTIPGAVYQFITERLSGNCSVYVKKWRPPIYEDEEDEPIPDVFLAQCPWAVGSILIRVKNTGETECQYRLTVNLIDDDIQTPVPYTMQQIVLNSPVQERRVGYHQSSLPYEEEALFYFDSPQAGVPYRLTVYCVEGRLHVTFGEETTFNDALVAWEILPDVNKHYVFTPPAAGKRYFLRVRGLEAVNYFRYVINTYDDP